MSPGKTDSMGVVQGQASAALESFFEPDHESQDAVSSFIQPVYDLYAEKLPTESRLADALDSLWTALLSKVLSTPYTDTKQDRLVTFVKGLKSLPPPDQPAPQVWGLSLWFDLPVLGAAVRDHWNIGPDAEDNHWLNLNAFAARLTASHVLDLSLYAIWTMRDALEMPLEDIKPDVRDQTIRAAALWIEFCGEHLRLLDQLWEPHPATGDPARGAALYSGPKGFCKERWQLWKERFGVLSREEGLKEDTREMVKDAERRMGSVLN